MMTQQQIDDVAIAARLAAIGQAQKGGDRCAFAIVVCGLEVGAPMAIQTNVVGAKPADVVRILQNGIRALQNTRGGIVLLSALLLWLGAMTIAVAGCGSVTAEGASDAQSDRAGAAGAGAGGDAGAGGAGGVAGGADPGAAGADGATGGAAAGGAAGDGAAGAGGSGLTGAAGGGGLTGAAGTAGAPSCAPRVSGALCYHCPEPSPTCPTSGRGAWLCCNKEGIPSCDLGWCS
jgi:hypothetical protein